MTKLRSIAPAFLVLIQLGCSKDQGAQNPARYGVPPPSETRMSSPQVPSPSGPAGQAPMPMAAPPAEEPMVPASRYIGDPYIVDPYATGGTGGMGGSGGMGGGSMAGNRSYDQSYGEFED